MDLLESCKEKLTYFRIKELKDVLTHLGLSKQGKKQDLVDRILAILSDDRGMWAKKNAVRKEEVAKLVDDTYRKMQVAGAADLASKSQATSDGVNVKLKEEAEDSYQMEKVRCLCGRTLHSDSMIKCEDPRCGVWQHMACVLVPEKTMDGIMPSPPDVFYCEICRMSRADPFWVNVAHPLLPVKLSITNVPADGSSPGQSIERTFQLTRADRDLLSKQEYDVQAWCMLLNDKVLFRMQWPQYADLQINGVPVRAINRPGSQLLGANGRDDGPIITPCTRDGINKISVKGCDARVFCVGVRIVKRRTLQQVLNMIPKEGDGEPFEEAVARVRRCVGGGDAAENADSDSDIEVVADFIPVNLRCPMSGLRMKVAGRFKPCPHMGCFDLEVFVEMNQRSRKWQCPICLKNYSLEKIIIDPYFNRITSKMRDFSEDVADIEVKPDGSWRATKSDGGDRKGLGELGMWHLPDGTICSSSGAESKQKRELKPVKQEGGSNSHAGLKLGIRKNQNGCWEFNKANDLSGISPANNRFHNFESNGQNIIPMSSSATGSGRDCEDGSVNQDGGNNLDFSAINGLEYESMSMNFDPNMAFNDQMVSASAPPGDAEVIVLSDSDDEIEPVRSSEAAAYKASASNTGEVTFPLHQNNIGGTDPYYENATLGNNSGMGVYGPNDDDFGINIWPMHSGGQGGPGFQLFGSDMDVSDALADMQHGGPLNGSSGINGYTLTGENPMGSDGFLTEPNAQNNTTMNDSSSLVDNPLAFGDDPSLQIFLPTRPSDSALNTQQQHVGDRQDVANSVRTEDWISLRLGDGSEAHREVAAAAASSGLSPEQQLQSNGGGGALDSLAEHASLLAGINNSNNASGKTSRGRSYSPVFIPRQKRSKPRLHLSIDTESSE